MKVSVKKKVEANKKKQLKG
jgi:hypothetical protein